jgi:hypothetical protein
MPAYDHWVAWLVVLPFAAGFALLGVAKGVPRLYAWGIEWAGIIAVVVVAIGAWVIRKPLPEGSLDDVSPVPQLAKVGAVWLLGAIPLGAGFILYRLLVSP